MSQEGNPHVWLQVAAGIQELSELLDTAESVDVKVWRKRHIYKRRLLELKEQAIRNSLLE